MLIILISVLALGVISCVIKFYLVPRSKINAYRRFFEQKGYRVYQFPYKILAYPIIQTIYNDSKKGDAFYSYKHLFQQYDVLLANHLHRPSISLLHPQLRKQFAKLQRDFIYEKFKLISSQKARFAGNGLAFSEGQDWKRKRKIMGSLFTFDLIKENVGAIEEICTKIFTQHENISSIQGKCGEFEFQIGAISSSIFSRVIVCLFLGLKTIDQEINGTPIGKFIIELANDANMQARGLLPYIFGIKYLDWGLKQKDRQINKRLRLFKNWVDDFVSHQIKQHDKAQSTMKKDILSIHIKNKDDKNDKQIKSNDLYNKQELIQELKIFLLAGTETSTNLFRMMVFYISQNQNVQSKLREQIKIALSENSLNFEQLKKLKYLQAVQKQTIRMYGPVNFNFPRRVLKDHYLLGIPISKETIIQYHSICTHYNPSFYQNPHQFNPERWIGVEDNNTSALLVGFGLGPRNCIGQHLALIQSKIIAIKFYQRYADVKIPSPPTQFRWKFLYKPDDFKVRVIKI